MRRNPSDKDMKLNDKLFAKISKQEYTGTNVSTVSQPHLQTLPFQKRS